MINIQFNITNPPSSYFYNFQINGMYGIPKPFDIIKYAGAEFKVLETPNIWEAKPQFFDRDPHIFIGVRLLEKNE